MIGIIDYKRGNIKSVLKAFLYLGFDARIIQSPREMKHVKKLVLPGVGAFGDCMEQINTLGFSEVIIDLLNKGMPFLGICLGLQLLFESSEESPEAKGLSVLKGKVTKFRGNYKIPHMGWNNVRFTSKNKFTKDIPEDSFFYFVHSYKIYPEEKNILFGETSYHENFASMILKENIFAAQFHPEKSQEAGLQLLKNWATGK